MRKALLTALSVILLAPVAFADEFAKEIDLFKRASLDQFDFYLDEDAKKESVFSFVGEETLKVTGKPFGWLATKAEYKNFKFETKYRWPQGVEPTNSGIFLRINGTSPNFLPRGVEIQLKPGSAGDIYGFHGMVVSGSKDRFSEDPNNKMCGHMRGVKKFRDAEKPAGQWNELKILCFEDLIVVWLNDKLVNWAHGVEIVPGKIGFQSEGGPVEFKDAEIDFD